MRKYLIGAIAGFLLSFSFTVYGEEFASLVGREIQGEFPVKVDGELLKNKAIVVDGTSYLPVREFGEKLGYKVGFDPEDGVTLDKMETQTPSQTQNQQSKIQPGVIIYPPTPQINEPEDPEKSLSYVESQIKYWEHQLMLIKGAIKMHQEDGKDTSSLEQKLKEAEAQLEKYQKLKAELEAQQSTQ